MNIPCRCRPPASTDKGAICYIQRNILTTMEYAQEYAQARYHRASGARPSACPARGDASHALRDSGRAPQIIH